MSTPSIQTLITQAQQVLNLKSSNEIRATLAAILANANVGTPLNPNLTTQQLWDEFYEIVRQPSDDIMSIITDQMMRMVFSPPAPGGAGADGQVIFNDGGVLAGDPQFLWNKTTNLLTVTGSATITGGLTVDTSTLKVDSTNNRVGIGTANPGVRVDIVSDSNTSLAPVLRVNSNNVAVNTSLAYDGLIGSSTLNIQSGTSSPIVFNTNGTNESGRINTNGVYVLKGGTTTANGVGVAFPATQVASSDANCLDDYEEGTWTPVFQGTTTNGTYVYSTAVGRYTKVGNLVTVFGNLVISSITTAATGVMRIGGLPFTTSSANVYAAATVGWVESITISSGTLALSVNTGGVIIDMYRIISGAGVGFITPSDLVVNTRINFTATYFV